MSRNSLGLPGRQTKTRVASLYDIVLFFNHFSLSVTMMSIFSSWSCLMETYLGRVTHWSLYIVTKKDDRMHKS